MNNLVINTVLSLYISMNFGRIAVGQLTNVSSQFARIGFPVNQCPIASANLIVWDVGKQSRNSGELSRDVCKIAADEMFC